MMVFIYALAEPSTQTVRYVGKTIDLRRRFATHCRADKTGTHKSRWIAGLISAGTKPILTTLEVVEESQWQEAERKWISRYRLGGCRLVNSTDGGDGGHNPPSDVRDKISRASKGKKFSDSHKAKIGNALKGRIFSAETLAKMSNSQRGNTRCVGRSLSEETRRKISEARRGQKVSEVTRAKNRLASAGRRHSPETRAKISEAKTRSWQQKKSTIQDS